MLSTDKQVQGATFMDWIHQSCATLFRPTKYEDLSEAFTHLKQASSASHYHMEFKKQS